MKAKTITVRVSQETADRCERLRLAGAHSGYMNSAFARIIFNIGLDKYEKTILPIETGEECQSWKETRLQAACCNMPSKKQPNSGAKIIPFPGASFNHGDDFQNTLDDFLREIGYIE
jgi:hypothetical protein